MSETQALKYVAEQLMMYSVYGIVSLVPITFLYCAFLYYYLDINFRRSIILNTAIPFLMKCCGFVFGIGALISILQ